MKSTYGKIFVILVVGICALFKIEAASAQLSVSVYPLSFTAKVNPGDTWRGSVTVINPNGYSIKVTPEKENFIGGAEGEILLTEHDQEFGLSSWIKYSSEKEIILMPGERRKVDFEVIVPQNAQPGGHYGAVLFRAKEVEQKNIKESGLSISGRVGSLMFFEVSGNIKKEGKISQLITPKFISHGPLNVSFKVQNNGNTFFLPEGKVEFNNLGIKVYNTWEPRVVFPGFDRTFKTVLNKKYLFGPIKITVLAKMSNGEELTPISKIVWAWPLQETGIVLIVFGALWLLKIWLLKNFKIVRIKKEDTNKDDKKEDV